MKKRKAKSLRKHIRMKKAEIKKDFWLKKDVEEKISSLEKNLTQKNK